MSESESDTVTYDTGRDLPLQIYNADDERDVADAIQEHSEQLTWHKLGDTTRNYSIVYNQASDPVAALGELIANSIDATLMRRYYERHGRDYDPAHELNSYTDAERLLTGDEVVEVVADGPKPDGFASAEKPYAYPNIGVLDRGHGQPAHRFEDTLVGFFLPGEQKDEFPFVQGRFGMGGSAVLPHSGDRMYKFIASASMDYPGRWTWTLVRDSPNVEERYFEFLKFNNELPMFTGPFESRKIGTVVRVYDYHYSSEVSRVPGEISSRFVELLDREMIRTPIPIRANERRTGYKSPSSARTNGLLDKLETRAETRGLIKRDFIEHFNFGGRVGRRPVRFVVLESDYDIEQDDGFRVKPDDLKSKYVGSALQRSQALFFTRNNQTHGDLGSTFLDNKCKKPRLSQDMLVFVDFSEFEPLEDLFKPSRDRMASSRVVKRIKDGLIDLIKGHDWLTSEEQRRRNQSQTEQREEKQSEIVREIANQNKDFAQMLKTGDLAPVREPTGDDSDDDPLCPLGQFPSTFEVITWRRGGDFRTWTAGKMYSQNHPVNKTQVLHFLLDAEDRYFDRNDRNGNFRFNADEEVVDNWGLNAGVLEVRLDEPGSDVEPGDTREITFTVTRHNRTPLQESVTVEYVEPVDYDTSSPQSDGDNTESRDLPDFRRVTEDGRVNTLAWDDSRLPGEMDQTTPVMVEEDGTGLQLYINHDMSAVRNYMRRKNLTDLDKDYVATVWDAGIQLYTTATYYHLNEKHEDLNPTDIIGDAIAGVAVTMLDQHIEDEELVGAN
jgi:hypothetical protein